MGRQYRPAIFAALLGAFAVSGCASGSGDYPSLAIREAERVQGTFPVEGADGAATTPAGPAPVDASTLEKAAIWLDQAKASHARFLEAVPQAQRTVANAGSGPDSTSWGSAQVALADLDSHRSDTAIALGDLDLAYVDATLSFVEREQIGQIRESVVALIGEEDDVLARLRGAMPQ
ncbi:hypothetical protein [Altererythrobacter epoxidivorans]|nr:hypothetical protein [Altererythrobacter epoxidivorans]